MEIVHKNVMEHLEVQHVTALLDMYWMVTIENVVVSLFSCDYKTIQT